MKKCISIILIVILLTITVSGCGKNKDEINIAEQFGVAYAPLQIMKEQKLLEKRLPGVTVNWKQFGGPTAIREGMLAGEIDFGFMGPAPAIMGIDNGMKWRFATGISFNRVAIVAKGPAVKKLVDIPQDKKIAVLSPACTQHVLLCMAAEQEFGDPQALDNRIVSMSHPDSLNAMLSNTEIAAHVATPPYLEQELAAGMGVLYTGEELMGQNFTFITGVALESFHDQNPEYYNAFIESLNEAIDYINDNLDQAVKQLAPYYGIPEEDLRSQMTYNGSIYSKKLQGVEELSAAMQRMGFTKQAFNFEQMTFDNVEK